MLAKSSVIDLAATVTSCRTPATVSESRTPCLTVLDRFTAPGVPVMGPAETPTPAGAWTNGVTPRNLPGHGLAQHSLLAVGENYDKKVVWVLQDWKDFNGITAVQILDDPGIPEIPGQSEH